MTPRNRWPAIGLIVFASLFARTTAAAPEWEDETVNDVNAEAPRATSVPYATRDQALSGDKARSTFVRMLNGDWKFHFAKRPEERPADFYKAGFDTAAWATIRVPGNWQLQGYGKPLVLNITYPFKVDPPRVTGEPPKDWTAYEHRNEVGSYVREFDVPADWDGRDIVLHFAGVESAMYVYVNGQRVGYSEDSYAPAEFRISQYLKPGRNTLAVEVYRWSDGSYLEDQDFVRLSGIFRDVYLYAQPKTHLRDFKADALLDATYIDGNLTVAATLRNVADAAAAQQSLTMELLDAAGNVVATETKSTDVPPGGEATLDFAAAVPRVAAWTAETPNLYALLLTLKDAAGDTLAIDRCRVGFRTVEIKDHRFLINGEPVKLRGVNRHETDPDTGRAVDEAGMLRDVRVMKRNNIDTVRTSHYPNHSRFYELCDEYGIYVVDEANVESHGMGFDRESLSHKPSWKQAHVERVRNLVHRDKNHPCVVMWSYGNEAGPGANFAASRDAVKAIDATRPTHYEGNSDYADVLSHMYAGHNRVRDIGRDLRPGAKPFFMCEYAHAQGNAGGGLEEYWDIVEGSPRLMGGCIWDFVDQGLRKPAPAGKRSPDGKDFFFAYGGDFDGDMPRDDLTVYDGLVDPDRNEGAKIAETKAVYQPIKFTAKTGAAGNVVTLTNRRAFTSLDDLTLAWSLTADGEVVEQGTMPAPDVAPGATVDVTLPVTDAPRVAGRHYFLNVSLALASATQWADAGHVVARGQIDQGRPTPAAAAAAAADFPPVETTQDGDRVTVRGKNFEATFDLKGASFETLSFDGNVVLTSGNGPALQMFRAPGDNDVWVKDQWWRLGLSALRPGECAGRLHRESDGIVRVYLDRTWHAKEDVTFTESTTYTIFGDGTIDAVVRLGSNRESLVIPRQGVRMFLPKTLDKLAWFGRGPLASYPDRTAAALFGRYATTVAGQFEPFARPQTMGNHSDTSWLTLTDLAGRGVLISSPTAFAFTALHFTERDLDGPRHPTDLTPRDDVVLSLDAAVLGLGSASCGPRPSPQFETRAAARVLHYRLNGIDASSDVVGIARRPHAVVAPVRIARDRLGRVTLATDTPGAKIVYAMNGRVPVAYAGAFDFRDAATITAHATRDGLLRSADAVQAFERLPDRSAWRATASTEQAGEGNAAHAIDGDPATYWHSQYTPATASAPHELTLDLGQPTTIKAVTYLPRQDGINGRARDYEVRLSETVDEWTTAASGRFDGGADAKTLPLKTPTRVRYVRLTIKSAAADQPFGTAAELGVVPAD